MAVLDTRAAKSETYFALRRRRKCIECGKRMTTLEMDPTLATIAVKLSLRKKLGILRRTVDEAVSDVVKYIEQNDRGSTRPSCSNCRTLAYVKRNGKRSDGSIRFKCKKCGNEVKDGT